MNKKCVFLVNKTRLQRAVLIIYDVLKDYSGSPILKTCTKMNGQKKIKLH